MATIKDKIRLAMIPSVYDGGISTSTSDYSGTVHSLLPIQHEGPNLVVNGGFDQDSDWTYDTGWVIADGIATYDNSGVAGNFIQSGFLEGGKTYILKFDTLETNGGDFGYTMSGTTTFINNIEANKTHEIKLVAESGNLRLRAASNFAGSIDNVSVQLVSNGDFDFERSSAATRVGSDGYIKDVQVIGEDLVQNGDFEEIGSELVTNGDFEDGENGWTTNSWEVSGGKLILPATSTDNANQNVNIVQNKSYKIDFNISNLSNGGLRVRLGLGDMSQTITSNGSHTVYLQHTTTNNVFRVYSDTSGEFNGSIDNISLKEVGQNWEVSSQSEISNGKARLYSSDGSFQYIQQQGVFDTSKTYKLEFDIVSSNGATLGFAGGIPDVQTTVLGKKVLYISPSTTYLQIKRSSGVTDITLDNISVKEITDDTDIPRLDYSNAAQPALLLEPERTNSVTHSEDFNEWFIGNVDVSSNEAVSPSGDLNAYELKPTQTTSTHLIAFSVTVTNVKTFSVFAKANGYTRFRLNTGSSANGFASFDLDNETITNSGGTYYSDSKIEDYGNGWYRCSITFLANAPNSHTLAIEDNSENVSFLGDGTSSIYVYGAQLETGSYATSYIPTNGETNGVTRNKDKADNAGDNIIFNDEEGVLYAEIAALENIGSDRTFAIHNSSNTQEYINLRIDELANRFQMVVRSGNANSTTRGINVINSLEFNKVAIRYKQGESFRIFANGDFENDTSSAGNPTPSGLNEMLFTGNFEGKVRSILYFDKALTNEELIRLTSSDITQVLRNYNRRGELLGATYESAHVQTKLNELF